MPSKKSPETFLAEMSVKHPDIEVLDTYKNSTTALRCRCLKDACGHEWMSTPHNLLSGCGCPKCGGTLRKTHAQFVDDLHLVNAGVEVIGKYRNQQSKVRVKCSIDGFEWDAWPENLLKGHGCPKCSASAASRLYAKEHTVFIHELATINPNITVLGQYKNRTTKLRCRCLVDGNEWMAAPAGLLSGQGCPECKRDVLRKRAKSQEQFQSEMHDINQDVDIVGQYKNAYTKITCRCKTCGHMWDAWPTNLLRLQGCPECASSRGEKAISLFLSRHGIQFEQFYKFDDCRHQRPLPFDFFLPDYNLCIEFDGKQHFEPISFGSSSVTAEELFNGIQMRDSIKNEYCRNHGIGLLRIPYTEFNNIDAILGDKLHIA